MRIIVLNFVLMAVGSTALGVIDLGPTANIPVEKDTSEEVISLDSIPVKQPNSPVFRPKLVAKPDQPLKGTFSAGLTPKGLLRLDTDNDEDLCAITLKQEKLDMLLRTPRKEMHFTLDLRQDRRLIAKTLPAYDYARTFEEVTGYPIDLKGKFASATLFEIVGVKDYRIICYSVTKNYSPTLHEIYDELNNDTPLKIQFDAPRIQNEELSTPANLEPSTATS